jgi:hypothetical protein
MMVSSLEFCLKYETVFLSLGDEMMKKIPMLIVAIALIFASLPMQNAIAATTKYEFTVVNYVNDTIIIEFTDKNAQEFDMVVPRYGSKTIELAKGDYQYSYTVCGVNRVGTLNLKGEKQWEILPCGVEPTKMRFNSHFAETLIVSLYGPLEMPEPEEEEYEVELGGNRILDLLSGHYIMTYEAACSTVASDPKTVFSEEIRVAKSGKTQITLHGCEWYDHPARVYAKPVPVKFKIVNHASFPLILQIVGPQGALLTVNPGVNIYNLIYGTYKYGYFLDNAYHTGYMMVTKNGLGSLVFKPSHIFELPTPGGTEDSGE